MAAAEKKLEAVPSKKTRPVHTFDVPPSLGEEIKKLGLVKLEPAEELMASKRSGSDAMRFAYELAKQSLVEIDGKPVGVADGSVDTAFTSMGPKLRQLVTLAYTKLHAATDEETKDFLSSQAVRVS